MPNEYRPATDVEPILDMQSPVPLTDPIAEDISRPAAEIKPALSPQRHGPSFTLPLIIITLLAVTTASLFYNQTQQLKVRVQDLTNTLASQKIEPIPEPTIEIPQVSTPSATSPLALAQAKYPEAQLILITSDNPHLENQTVTKYWFRQSPDAKNYLYISFIADESSLVDQQVYVSPDNNIPSLNQRMQDNQLGLTQVQALTLTNSLCKQPEKCQQATAIKTQFLDTGSSLLWQITYQLQDSSQPVIFQINSLTKEVVYQSQK
ncbi:hypothetical protein KKG65_03125 [Patescibacteria group bacterium]|nr:hypothetical protein [Patescibacteria group bacterium]